MNQNIPENEKTPLVTSLLETINEQAKKIEALEQEILKLKKETIKPNIKPSKLNRDNKGDNRKPKKRSTKGRHPS